MRDLLVDVLLLALALLGLYFFFQLQYSNPTGGDESVCANTITAAEPLRTAVLTFEDVSGMYGKIADLLGWDIKEGIADMLETSLVKYPQKFDVYAREELKDLVIGEQVFQNFSGFVSGDTAVEIGRMTGVEILVTGKVTDFAVRTIPSPILQATGTVITADFRVVDTTTGKILMADAVSGWTVGGDIEKLDLTTVTRAARDTANKMAKAIAQCIVVY